MLYELINPSDQTTFQTDDFETAALATILVGGGQYAAEPQDDDAEKVPLFLFGGAEKWVEEKFGFQPNDSEKWVQDWMGRKREPLIQCLRTFCYGSASSRKLYDLALQAIDDPEKRAAFIEQWNDTNRSSMNNIMGRAHALARKLEQEAVAA